MGGRGRRASRLRCRRLWALSSQAPGSTTTSPTSHSSIIPHFGPPLPAISGQGFATIGSLPGHRKPLDEAYKRSAPWSSSHTITCIPARPGIDRAVLALCQRPAQNIQLSRRGSAVCGRSGCLSISADIASRGPSSWLARTRRCARLRYHGGRFCLPRIPASRHS